MVKNSKSNHLAKDFLDKLKSYQDEGLIPSKVGITLEYFFHDYMRALEENGLVSSDYLWLFYDYLEIVKNQTHAPYHFEPYHKMVEEPYNFHKFGIEFFRPLIHMEKSTLLGLDNVKEIESHIASGHNVVLFANHQIEADPIAIFLFLEKTAPLLVKKLIFVAGERVITDPLAVPFSIGCNLLCIYSKRYIDNPPELKAEKQSHNGKTMKLMRHLLDEGGHCIYVAPSGGRDRPDKDGKIYPAPFDPQSIEMFYLMASHAQKPTYFYPLSLATYSILPPPETIQTELGEKRNTKASAIHLAFGNAVNEEAFLDPHLEDKHLRRKARSDYIYNLVCENYTKLI